MSMKIQGTNPVNQNQSIQNEGLSLAKLGGEILSLASQAGDFASEMLGLASGSLQQVFGDDGVMEILSTQAEATGGADPSDFGAVS